MSEFCNRNYNRHYMQIFLQIFTLLGALGMFLYGMTLMSEGLQKAAGDKLRSFLASMTSTPFKQVLTGLGITAIIQSSSATTVMVVSFVNAGLLSLANAIGVIMGANIGTTVTAWLISILGFTVDIASLSIPLMAVGFVFFVSKKSKNKSVGELIIGFALLFLGLNFLKNSVPDLNQSPEVLSFLQQWSGYGYGSVLLFVVIGTLLTIVLQSSSATMALTLVMVNAGWIPFDIATAMVLGENIGTTITANIAAAVANVSAKRAARAHTVFNVFGVIWVLILYRPFLKLIGMIVEALGYPNPMTSDFSDAHPGTDEYAALQTSALYGVSMLHTLFNTINTCILIWFVPVIEKLVTWMVKSPAGDEEIFRLRFIQGGPLSTAELSLDEAKQEIVHFAEICHKGFGYVREAINETDKDNKGRMKSLRFRLDTKVDPVYGQYHEMYLLSDDGNEYRIFPLFPFDSDISGKWIDYDDQSPAGIAYKINAERFNKSSFTPSRWRVDRIEIDSDSTSAYIQTSAFGITVMTTTSYRLYMEDGRAMMEFETTGSGIAGAVIFKNPNPGEGDAFILERIQQEGRV